MVELELEQEVVVVAREGLGLHSEVKLVLVVKLIIEALAAFDN